MEKEEGILDRRLGYFGGLFVFVVSLAVYFRTVAPTESFWDCGEFIACSCILGVIHPPGAPLYLLIGRILTMLPFFGDTGLRVNVFSNLVSAGSILFTYLIIVRLIQRWRGEVKSWEDRVIVYGSAVFGSLAFAFTDSFWFNAVEAEVYAFSMFFTALVVWLALYWGERSEKAGSLLLIFFIFYLFGLATGVHLLNILAFPFVLLIAFFHDNQTVKRLLLLIFIQVVVPIGLYVVFYQFDPSKMQYRELMAHQAKAGGFLKWFGLFWVAGSLVYMYIKDRQVFALWWVIPVLVLLAYSVYLVIYLRAGLAPPINENNPSTLKGMMYYLSRKQYGSEDMFLTFMHRKADFWNYQIHKMYTRYFGWQFIGKGGLLDYNDRIVEIISLRGLYGLPFVVGLWGAVHHFFKDWKRAVAVLVLFFLTGYAIIIYLNQPDPQPRERDYSYVGSFFAFSLWIGIGMAGILEWISEGLKARASLKKAVYALVGVLLFVAVPVNLFAFNFHSHDRSGNYVAWDYSYNILQTCESGGIIFTNGDNDTFPLWYLQEVEGIRKDVKVVCLSLLNTGWYIRQLRDQEPQIPIRLTDRDIAILEEHTLLAATAASLNQFTDKEAQDVLQEEIKRLMKEGKLPSDYDFRMYGFPFKWWEKVGFSVPVEGSVLKMKFQPEYGNYLRVQDYMIMKILSDCSSTRPIYFAITVGLENKIGLDAYLRMDGMAFKVMPYAVKALDVERLRTNLLERFQYRGMDDPKVFYDVGTLKLFINLRHAFLRLAYDYITKDKKDEALFILDEMNKKMPEDHVLYADEGMALSVAEHYKWAGRPGDYRERTKYVVPGRQLSRNEREYLANYYAQVVNDWDRSEALYRKLIQENPNDVQAVSGLVWMLEASKQYEKGMQVLEDWLMRHPGDPNAKIKLEEFKKKAFPDTTIHNVMNKNIQNN